MYGGNKARARLTQSTPKWPRIWRQLMADKPCSIIDECASHPCWVQSDFYFWSSWRNSIWIPGIRTTYNNKTLAVQKPTFVYMFRLMNVEDFLLLIPSGVRWLKLYLCSSFYLVTRPLSKWPRRLTNWTKSNIFSSRKFVLHSYVVFPLVLTPVTLLLSLVWPHNQ